MKIDVITLFPELVDFPLSQSIVGRARKNGLLELAFTNPREFTEDRHKTVDDKPYGGGRGMVMMVGPVYKAVKKVSGKSSYKILLSPRGTPFSQSKAAFLAKKKRLTLVCAHYEGIDERISGFVDEELSVGDYVLTGGEPAAVCVIDAVARLIKGVIKEGSLETESFNEGLLEAPQYTRPSVWRKLPVPPVLLSGNHKEIEKWRKARSLEITAERRPELLEKTGKDR